MSSLSDAINERMGTEGGKNVAHYFSLIRLYYYFYVSNCASHDATIGREFSDLDNRVKKQCPALSSLKKAAKTPLINFRLSGCITTCITIICRVSNCASHDATIERAFIDLDDQDKKQCPAYLLQ